MCLLESVLTFMLLIEFTLSPLDRYIANPNEIQDPVNNPPDTQSSISGSGLWFCRAGISAVAGILRTKSAVNC